MTDTLADELRKELQWIFDVDMLKLSVGKFDDTINQVVGIVAAHERALLDSLLEQAVEVTTVQYNYDNGDKVVAGFTNSAVPLAVIQAKRKELL